MHALPRVSANLKTAACLLGLWIWIGVAAPVQAENRGDGLTPVRVQLKWRHQFQFAGYYAAIEKGFYRDAGLDVTLIEYSPGVTPIDQLMQGRVEFAVADTGALIYRASGVPLVALAAIYQHSPSILMTRADTGIETLEDLRFRRLMLGGGFMNAELTTMLRNAGLPVEKLDLVPSDTSLDTLIDGRVDAYTAYTTNEPYFMAQRKIPFKIFQPRDYGVDFYGDVLLTNEKLIDEKPDMVEAFRAATLKGWSYAVGHPDELIEVILKRYNTQNKVREHLEFEALELTKLILPNVVPIGYMNEERWRRIQAVFEQQGRLSDQVNLTRFMYPSGDWGQIMQYIDRYRAELAAGIVVLLALLAVSHIASLRVQIKARTRELEVAKRRAEDEARTDELTGLSNRRAFFEGFGRDIARAERQNAPVSLILADVDNFKQINDTHGHSVGDVVLRRVGGVLRAHVRSGDLDARIGGEEFALGCFGSPLEETRQLAERLRREIEQMGMTHDGRPLTVTLSFGVTERAPGQTAEQMFDDADRALYEAKRGGRNRVVAHAPQDT
ncbi:GGDEF domain-containing protein [Thalassospiraceae bacterium LMO-SO8]|nr:GGDEF domain-containing protein [Alphaproteobacteria bacterium LMO-S08]WND75900.1 GGDEF domain-containing protein [Thalassospiraceae bacterium LMO-SO8]